MIITVNKKALKFTTVYNANIQGGFKTQLYAKVLLQRPWWRQTKSEHNANLTVSVSPLDPSIFSAKASPVCVFNQLPGLDLLLNEQRLYDAFYANYKEKTYESLKLSYKLPSEITKLLNHLHYGDRHKTNEAASFTFDSGLAGKFQEIQEQWIVEYEKKRKEAADARRSSRKAQRAKFAPNVIPPVNQDYEKYVKQEDINDLIWGVNFSQKSMVSLGNVPAPIKASSSAKGTHKTLKSSFNEENATEKSTPGLTTSQLSTSHLPRLSTPQSKINTSMRSNSSHVNSPVSVSSKITRIETLPYAPKKEVKSDAPPQSLPPQYAVVDPKINQANSWEVLKDGKAVQVVYSLTNFVAYFGKSMRKILRKHRWQVRKCCERRLILNDKPVLLRRYVLIKAGGDVYVYDEPLFELEEETPDTAELEGTTKLFTRYYDARLFPAQTMDELVHQKFQTFNFFRHNIDIPSRQIIVKTILAQQQQLQRQTQSPGSFALLEYRFQIGGYTDGFPVRLEGISADFDMTPKSAVTFVLFPALLDDLFELTVDQTMAEHAPECRKLLQAESSAERYAKKLSDMKEENDGEKQVETTKRISPEDFKAAKGEVGKLAVLIADVPVDSRRLDFLRYAGGREINQFVPLIIKWACIE